MSPPSPMDPPISKCKFAHREHLLPSNATDLERALSLSMNPMARLGPGIDDLRGFKFDPADPLLPWLIWEYGLGELLPYLIDPRRAIAEGILWQRLRGTPKALEVALSWVDTIVTVEQEPPGEHYAEFQIDPGRVIDDDEWIERVLAIVQLSAPARSRLSRMYHGYDLRRFMLDTDMLGDALLSDNSGVIWWGDGYTKLSFGRSREEIAILDSVKLESAFVPVRATVVKYGDRCLLDWMLLDTCVPVPNPFIMHSHLFVNANRLGALDPSPFPRRKFCKAEVVPSDDGWRLGDTNACLPRFKLVETGDWFRLSSESDLSVTRVRIEREEVTERFDRSQPVDVAIPTFAFTPARSSMHGAYGLGLGFWLGVLRTGIDKVIRDAWQRESTKTWENPPMVEQVEIIDEDEVFVRVEHGGPVRLSEGRTGEPWRLESVAKTVRRTSYWSRVPALTTPERKFCRAEIVSSDDGLALGNTNACTPRFFWQETGEKMSLGQSLLSDTPWHMRRVEITERFDVQHPVSMTIPNPAWDVAENRDTIARIRNAQDHALGFFCLSDAKPDIVHSIKGALYSPFNTDPSPDPADFPERRFCRAMVVLSESAELGEIQARTPRRALYRTTNDIPALGSMLLSDAGPEIECRQITVMEPRQTGSAATLPNDTALTASAQNCSTAFSLAWAEHVLGFFMLGDAKPVYAPITCPRESTLAVSATWTGQTWTGASWPQNTSWQSLRENIASTTTQEAL